MDNKVEAISRSVRIYEDTLATVNAVVDNRLLQKKIANTKKQINSEMLNIIKEISVNIS